MLEYEIAPNLKAFTHGFFKRKGGVSKGIISVSSLDVHKENNKKNSKNFFNYPPAPPTLPIFILFVLTLSCSLHFSF